jgi:hypothetical protein
MANPGFGVVAAIAAAVLVAVVIIFNSVRKRGSGQGAANAPAPASTSQPGPDTAGMQTVMSQMVTKAHSQPAFDQYLADHTPEQLDDVPVYAVAHIITASFPSTSRAKWLERVAAAVVPRGADPELVHTADHFWEVNEKWLFSQTAFADFCNQYLIANKDAWPPAVHERIVLAGLTALASRAPGDTASPADMTRVATDFLNGLNMVSDAYFGAESEQVRARLMGEADRLALGIGKS